MRHLRLVLAVLIALLLTPAAASAVTRTVAPGASINAALVASAPGDIVQLRGGVHPFATITAQKTDYVFIEPFPGETVTVRGMRFDNASYVYVRSIAGASSINSNTTATDAVRVDQGSDHVVFLQNRLVGSRVGFRVIGTSDVANWPTTVHAAGNDISGSYVDAVQVGAGNDVEIRANTIHDTLVNGQHNDGVQVYGGTNVRILRNRISFTTPQASGPNQGIIVGHADPASSWQRVSNVRVENNLVHHWPGTGLTIAGVDGITIDNNTIYDAGTGGSWSMAISEKNSASFDNTNVTLANNIIEILSIVNGGSRPNVETHNLVRTGGGGASLQTTDPLFGVDYRLTATSPPRDTANTIYAPLVDFSNTTRDATPDRGAREYPN